MISSSQHRCHQKVNEKPINFNGNEEKRVLSESIFQFWFPTTISTPHSIQLLIWTKRKKKIKFRHDNFSFLTCHSIAGSFLQPNFPRIVRDWFSFWNSSFHSNVNRIFQFFSFAISGKVSQFANLWRWIDEKNISRAAGNDDCGFVDWISCRAEFLIGREIDWIDWKIFFEKWRKFLYYEEIDEMKIFRVFLIILKMFLLMVFF